MLRLVAAMLLLGMTACGPQPPTDLMREVQALDDVPWLLETLRGQHVLPLERGPLEEDNPPIDDDEAYEARRQGERDAPQLPSIEFEEEDGGWSISGFAGCNTYSASCTIDGAALTIGPIAATRKYCPDDTLEYRFLQVLDQASEIRLKRKALFLLDQDTVLATFVPDFE